jgi:hypothetical protein
MQIYTEKTSGKYFLLVEGRKGERALMVGPEGEEKILDFEQLDYMPVLALNVNIVSELLTENQLRVYYERNKA